MRRPNISVADGMISAVLNMVVHASEGERAAALRWAQRRLAKSSLPPEAAAELFDGLRRGDSTSPEAIRQARSF